MQPLIAVVGPTASGKTALALDLAAAFGGELVSADAKQLFIGMDIGTNKVKTEIPQHLIDVLEPGVKPKVYWYQKEAYKVIDSLHERGVLPIMVGGSMLYAESVLQGYVFREGEKSTEAHQRYRSLALGIQVSGEVLKERLAERTNRWLESGLLDEVRNLRENGVSDDWISWCGLEYREMLHVLRGEKTLSEAVEATNASQWQYVRRQYTWWRRYGRVVWVATPEEAIEEVRGFLSATD